MSTKKQRRALANKLAIIAIATGATVEIHEVPALGRKRGCRVDVWWPYKVRCGFDIDDLHGGGILASFHRAEKPLAMGPWFDSINEYHRTKATLYASDAAMFIDRWQVACEAVADGRAFVDGG